jgi:hypothetical protein
MDRRGVRYHQLRMETTHRLIVIDSDALVEFHPGHMIEMAKKAVRKTQGLSHDDEAWTRTSSGRW